MANGYAKLFTLQEIFNNKELAGKIPLVNYKEKTDDTGKDHRTTNMKSVGKIVYETAKASAKPYYKPLLASKTGDTITISGTPITELDAPFEAVYMAIKSQVGMIKFTANNADMIRSAVKESANIKRKTGQEPKVWLKIGSMQEIKTMGQKQLNAFIDDVMRNIFYNPEFAETQRKYGVEKIPVNRSTNYAQRQKNWLNKVGEV